MDTEELGQNEQDAPLAWFGAQPPPRPPRRSPPSRSFEFSEDDPTLPRSFLRSPPPSSASASRGDNAEGHEAGDGGGGGGGGGKGSLGFGGDEAGAAAAAAGIAAAGVGAAHVLTGPGRLEDGAWEEASSACPGMR